MAGYYTYLIASLPFLHFGGKPPFSRERVFEMCAGLLTEQELIVITRAAAGRELTAEEEQPTLRAWIAFERSLRNETAKIRAARKHVDPTSYLRPDGQYDPSVAHLAMHAFRATTILEREKLLDEARWEYLEELSIGHYFDIDALIIYVIKLALLERWEQIGTADKPEQLAALVGPA